MKEITGDLFEQTQADAICITTNGFVTARCVAVMGAGCAGQAKQRWPGIEYLLSALIMERGNHVHVLTNEILETYDGCVNPFGPAPCLLTSPWTGTDHELPYRLVSFPTKPQVVHIGAGPESSLDQIIPKYRESKRVTYPGWMARSDLELIIRSAQELVGISTLRGWQQVILPQPGCGFGGLRWEAVRPILSEILDDRFSVITHPRT